MSSFVWCGETISFAEGETIAAALLRNGFRDLLPNGIGPASGRVFCGIGSCQSCLVRNEGSAAMEACITLARAGMRLTPVLPLTMSVGTHD